MSEKVSPHGILYGMTHEELVQHLIRSHGARGSDIVSLREESLAQKHLRVHFPANPSLHEPDEPLTLSDAITKAYEHVMSSPLAP